MQNQKIYYESKKYMPGGVNSPVRAFTGLDIAPPALVKGEGAYVYDIEGKRYADYVGAWGPMILGHCDEDVVRAIEDTVRISIAFGAVTELELLFARFICETAGVEMIRFVNSGTEAAMSAVRLARGFTGRDKVVKFSGCYHGHYDAFLVAAGSGIMTQGIAGSAGVPQDHVKNTIICNYNDVEKIHHIFSKFGEQIACVIVEPVAANMGVIPAKEEFLAELRRLCDLYGSLLIFDEVITGFRVAYKGAREIYGIEPDLITFGKIIGGGLPCGAYGGRKDIMSLLSPLGPVYQAGTMSGNPIVMAAGYATVKKIYDNRDKFYSYLENLGQKMENGLKKAFSEKGIKVVINRIGSMLTVFFNENEKVENYERARESDVTIYRHFAEQMILKGNYISPSQFEALFLSIKHTDYEVEKFIEDVYQIF